MIASAVNELLRINPVDLKNALSQLNGGAELMGVGVAQSEYTSSRQIALYRALYPPGRI
jgi:hypothetical protein